MFIIYYEHYMTQVTPPIKTFGKHFEITPSFPGNYRIRISEKKDLKQNTTQNATDETQLNFLPKT